ncbi:phytoene desaturase family protein [Streptomyces sp. BI20]|uniref:phytoene desaturase family protein n=1 Tax=Streptomyces sp. BI20 TaxID=3403460 RepID=UPI003C769703
MARIAVIGAGTGAMATAARLAVAGHTVTVHERGPGPGGALGRYSRDGFSFDTGPGLLTLPAVQRDLFVKTGKRPLEDRVELVQVDPAVRHLLADGRTAVTLPNASRGGVAAVLDTALGAGAGARWSEFMVRARTAWDRSRRPLLEEPLWPNWRDLADRDPYPALRGSGLLRRRPPTLAEVADRELGRPLAALLTGEARAHGLDPARVPASAAILPYMEQTFGSWYVRGGMRALAEALYERCLERRVAFVFDSPVRGVLVADGRAAGLRLADGSEVPADHVVCAVDPLSLPEPPPGLPSPDAVPPREPATSRQSLFLALRGPRPADTVHRTLVHGPDSAVTVLRPEDPACVPDPGHEAVTVRTSCPAGEPGDRTEELLAAARRAVPDLDARLLWAHPHTPTDVAAETGARGGAVPPPVLAGGSGAWLYPSNTGPLPGLWLAGGWAHPGGGLPHAGMTGALVAGLIVEGAEFRGSR